VSYAQMSVEEGENFFPTIIYPNEANEIKWKIQFLIFKNLKITQVPLV
jgi:aspartate 1-decarboxylase